MKLSVKTFTVLFAAATMYACNSDSTTTSTDADSTGSDKPAAMDTTHSLTDTANTGATTSTTSNPEQDFLNYAIPANAKEIIWLKAGLAQASLKDIKNHSSMMLKDHKKLEATVKTYLSKNPSIAMPALDTANTVNINDKTGAGWDKAWTDKMVADHNELLDKLKKAQGDVKDAELKKIITSTIPVVESHLSMTKMIQDQLNK